MTDSDLCIKAVDANCYSTALIDYRFEFYSTSNKVKARCARCDDGYFVDAD